MISAILSNISPDEIALAIITIIVVLEKILTFFHTRKQEKKNEKNPNGYQDITREIDKTVDLFDVENNALNNLLEGSYADRIQVFNLHNGGCGADGMRFIKMSCTNEKVRYGNDPQLDTLQGMYIPNYLDFAKPLIKGQETVVDDVENIKDVSMYPVLKRQNLKSFVAVPLKTEGRPFGFVLVGFNNTSFNNSELEKLKTLVRQITCTIETVHSTSKSNDK